MNQWTDLKLILAFEVIVFIRHEALQPFSRDYNVGLIAARLLVEDPSAEALAELLDVWRDENSRSFRRRAAYT